MAHSNYPNHQYLTSVAQLSELLHEPQKNTQLKIFDATVYLRPVKQDNKHIMTASSGLPEYSAAHLPGSAFIDQLTHLSVADTPLRFTLPPAAELAAGFAAAGVNADSHVVFYSSGHFMWATRAWWLLRYCGHNNVSVLDGGLGAWQAAGQPTETKSSTYAKGSFAAEPGELRSDMFANTDDMLASMDNPAVCTINALPEPMYNGSSPIKYGRPGHIPGSTNLPYSNLLQPQTEQNQPAREIPLETLLPASELKNQLEKHQLLGEKPVITYCGGGIAATVPAFAAILMGKQEIAVYDGSMSEWSQDPSRPLVTGDS